MSCLCCIVSLHKVVEVREGQRSTMFDKFPYEQVENQSFSLVYLHEGILPLTVYSNNVTAIMNFGLYVDKRYAYLTSLDLICDYPQNYDLWINEVGRKKYAAGILYILLCSHTQYQFNPT